MSSAPPFSESRYDEQDDQEDESVGSATSKTEDHRSGHDNNPTAKQNHQIEPVESISPSISRNGSASWPEDESDQDVEANTVEAPYTVFTASQKRFIVFLTACAGFFSAVSLFSSSDSHV